MQTTQFVSEPNIGQFYDGLSPMERAEYAELIQQAEIMAATLSGMLAKIILRPDPDSRKLCREIKSYWYGRPVSDMAALQDWIARTLKAMARFEKQVG